MVKTPTFDNLCEGCFTPLAEGAAHCEACGYDEKTHTVLPHQLPPLTILNGKFLIGRVLGEGGFGITYIGWDLNLDIKVAIKEYYPAGLVTRSGTLTVPYTGEKETTFNNGKGKFIFEAKNLAKFYILPGIVSVKDYFHENGTAYIVMDFLEGKTLKTVLAENGGKLDVNVVLKYMRPIMDSLKDVHKAGIIHRDISPDNMIVSENNDTKLIDFGAARTMTDGQKSISVVLKPGYAPEEQYRAKGQQGSWTDVYALCATIYKAITGTTPDEALERARKDMLKTPRELGVIIDSDIEAALMKGLSVFQENRFQSIDELYSAIYVPFDKPPEPKLPPVISKTKILASALVITIASSLCFVLFNSQEKTADNMPVEIKTDLYSIKCSYTGDIKDNIPNGEGSAVVLEYNEDDQFIWYDGSVYEGEFKDGLPNGQGSFTDSTGNVLNCTFENGIANGRGTLDFSDGGKYEGHIEKNRINGEGTLVLADGERYEGSFKDGKRDGRGVHIWPGGDRYEGDLKDDKLNGEGVMTWTDGRIYEGAFENDTINGRGTLKLSDGQVYQGWFKDGKYHGEGTYTWPDGRRYEGDFYNGQFSGYGVLTDSGNNVIYEGKWSEDGYITLQ